jgi:hypothetical protein
VGRNDPKWIQEGLKIKVLRNQTKPAPLHRARRADSDHIFFFSENGHRMQKLSRSEDQVKHAKKSQSQSQSQSQR